MEEVYHILQTFGADLYLFCCWQILLVKRIEEVLDHAFEDGCPLRLRSKL
jgi:hypothetical protein